MSTEVELIQVTATFSLPDWFAPTESMTWSETPHGLHGTTTTRDSPHEQALFAMFPEQTECCVAAESKWVTLAIDQDEPDLTKAIDFKRVHLLEFLRRLKEDTA